MKLFINVRDEDEPELSTAEHYNGKLHTDHQLLIFKV